MFAVVVSEYVPVAVNCCVVPFATVGFTGVTAIDCSVAAVTVSTELFDVTPPCPALMFVVPTVTPVARPVVAPIVATPTLDDVHVAVLVTFPVVPSE